MKKWINKNFDNISIIILLSSAIIIGINLFKQIKSPLLTLLGCILAIIGILMTTINIRNAMPKRGFRYVVSDKRKNVYSKFPTRSSINSAGYDFYSNDDYDIEPNAIVKIWTDLKAYMQPDEFLMLNVRSSMGGKFMLANTIGIIDSDYYSNPDNDGNIGIFLKNISDKTLHIARGDKIAQGIFLKYLKIDGDNTTGTRQGGFGSSGK